MIFKKCKDVDEFMDCIYNHVPARLTYVDAPKVCVDIAKDGTPIYGHLTDPNMYASRCITCDPNRKEYIYNPLRGISRCSCLKEFLDNVDGGYVSVIYDPYCSYVTQKQLDYLYELEQKRKIVYDEDLILSSYSYFTNAPFALKSGKYISDDIKQLSNKEDISKQDNVNHPKHYATSNGMEAIDVIESFTEGLDPKEAINTAQVLKYMLRWGKKNGLEDLKKAQWYLNRLIGIVKDKNND